MNSLDPWRVIAIDAYGDVVWPRPQYQHPFYSEVPSWISYGGEEEDGATRLLFDGAFVGANYSGVEMSNNKGGITFKKELDDRQILRVEICVDGKCYRSSMNLAPAIAMIWAKLADVHADFHRSMGGACSSPDATAAVDRAVSTAGDTLIGMLAYQHAVGHGAYNSYIGRGDGDVAVGDFFGDIGHALGSAADAVGGVLKDLKGPISVAAGAAATVFGGPAAGPLAAGLAGSLIDAAPGGHPATQAAAQQKVATAKQAAATNPTMQTALDAANHATLQTTAAALGHPAIPATPNTLSAVVQKFLPLAVNAVTSQGASNGGGVTLSSDLQGALSTFGSMFGGSAPAVSGWYDIVGATIVGSFWNDVKNAVLTVTLVKPTNQFIKAAHLEPLVKLAATTVATIYGGPAAGAAAGALSPLVMNLGVDDKKKAAAAQADVHGVKVLAQQAGPQMAQAADIAHSAIENTATAYQIAQIVKDARAGNPQAQQTLANLQAAAAQGDSKAAKALQAADMIDLAQQGAPPGSAPVGAWQQIAGVVVGCAACEAQSMWHAAVGTAAVGAAVDDLRERARGYATAKSGNAAGVIQTADGRFQTRGFPSLDAAIDWLQRSTSRRGDFVYAAAYEKSADGAAYIQDEEFGSAVAPTVSGGAYGGAAYAAG